MGIRPSRLALDLILAVSVLALLRSPPNLIGSNQTSPTANVQLPTLPRRSTYHDFQHYVNQWLDWLVSSVPEVILRQQGTYTNEAFEPLPLVDAATILRVQGNARGTATSGSTIAVTQISAPSSGDVNVATFAISYSSSGSPITVSSISQTGVSWSFALRRNNGANQATEIWYGIVGSDASASLTANLNLGSSTLQDGIINVCEYSGLTTSNLLDKTASNSGAAASETSGTTATTTQPAELWIASFAEYDASVSSPTNGFTLLDGVKDTSISNGYLEKIASATGAASTGVTGTANNGWAACIAAFEATTSQPPAEFTISASPTSQSIGAGGTASSILTITAGGGFSGTVSLSLTSGCPSGVTCTVSPNSISTSGTATLFVPTLTTTSGTFPVVVTATSGSLNQQVTFSVTATLPTSFNFNVQSTTTQVVVTVTWVGSGSASVTITGPGGTPTLSESGAVVYNRTSYISGVSPPTNIHRVTFTLSSPPAGVWTAYVSQPGATVTIEVS